VTVTEQADDKAAKARAANPIVVSPAKVKLKAAKLKKKTVKVKAKKAFKMTGAKGKVTYKRIGISFLSISVSLLCIFGSMFGLWLFGLDLSVTALLGVISLIGIIVRNAIIMYDYAGELRAKEHIAVHDAAYEAGLRRMRPIFLTSATTALGVIPMIIAKTLLWEPMGVVICFGTIFTFPLVVTVLPVAYCLAFDAGEREQNRLKKVNQRFLDRLDERDKRNEEKNKNEENNAQS
jgi:predicted RND superfamily exporter protein